MSSPSVATLVEWDGDYRKNDTNTDKNEPAIVMTKEEDNNAIHRTTSVCLEKNSPSCHPPHVIRDGGLAAWGTTLGAWCMLFCASGLTNSYGVYQDYYVRVHLSNYSPSIVGWIGSFQVFLELGVGLMAGLLFDKGYFYHMTFGFSTLFLISNFMLSFAQPQQFYQVFLTQGVGVGISVGFLALPAVSVISHHFERKRALAMGIAISGSSCGGIVFPVLINKTIEKYGFPRATQITVIVCLGLMSISLALMRTRPPPQVEGPEPPSVPAILKDVPYVLAVLASLANLIGVLFLIFYLQLYVITKGVDRTLAFYALTILNGASTLGRILPNFLADIVGVYNVAIITAFACGVITLATLAVDNNNTSIICLAVLSGFPGGAYISLLGPLFASLSQSVSEVGLRTGLAFTILSVGALVGSPIQGALLTSSFHWERPIIFSAACFFVGTAGLCISRMLQVRRKGSWKV